MGRGETSRFEHLSLSTVAALIALALSGGLARAQGSGEDVAKSLTAEAQACAVICLAEADLQLFGATIVIPFQRPSVEQCGIWLSTTKEARAQRIAEQRTETDRLANEHHYSARERQQLHKKSLEQLTSCDASFKKRCEATRSSVPLVRRKAALAAVKKGIDDLPIAERRTAVAKYLKIVLQQCPLDQ